MDMKKAFIGVGIGVMVVTGLIQSRVIDVNEISTEATSESNQSATETVKQLFTTPEPTEVVFRLESLEGGILCGLPPGRHVITAEQTQLAVTNRIDGKTYAINSILGGLFGQPVAELPYKKENSEWSILFNKKPSGSEATIDKDGCVKVTLNITKHQRVDWYTLSDPVDIDITAQ
jgi:hypothetical protein